MEAITANKVLFFNSNALSKSFIRLHHHHRIHRFVCCIQSRDNQQLKLVKLKETHIVQPVLMTLAPKPKPKPKRIPKLVELIVDGLFLTAAVGSLWISCVTLPMTYDNMISNATEFSDSQFDSVVVASSYTVLEFEMLIFVMLFLTFILVLMHERECIKNGNRMRAAFKLAALIIIGVFVGCSFRVVSLAHARDTWLSTLGHGPWHLIFVLFVIVFNITAFGGCAIGDIRQLEKRLNTQICVGVGSGTQDGDSKSRKHSRRPRKNSRRRGIIVLNKHLGRVKRSRRQRKKSSRRGTTVLNKDLGEGACP